jgi:hypothetical protein
MIGETSVESAMPATLADRLRWAQAADGEDAQAIGGWSVNGPAVTPPEDRPVRIRVTLCGIKLAFYSASRPLPPFKLTIPHAQWAQMVELIAKTAPRAPGFEAFVGFTPESLALHQIDAVEAEL